MQPPSRPEFREAVSVHGKDEGGLIRREGLGLASDTCRLSALLQLFPSELMFDSYCGVSLEVRMVHFMLALGSTLVCFHFLGGVFSSVFLSLILAVIFGRDGMLVISPGFLGSVFFLSVLFRKVFT